MVRVSYLAGKIDLEGICDVGEYNFSGRNGNFLLF